MKWLKRLAVVLLALLGLSGLFAWWLLASESGARFALERAKSFLVDKLSYAQLRGALASPLELHDLHYRDTAAGLDVRIKSIKVEYSLYGLFSKTLHVAHLDVDGVDVALSSVPPTPAPTPAVPAPTPQQLLTPPLALLLDDAHVAHIAIVRDGKPVFAADRFDLAAQWTNDGLSVRQLALRAPDGKIDLAGAITSYKDYRGNAKLAFDWRVAPRRYAGVLDIANDGHQTALSLKLDQPTAATASGNVTPGDALPWSLTATVPRFDPRSVGVDGVQSAALELKGSGDRTRVNVTGSVELDGHRVLLDPLALSYRDQTVTIESARLRSPEASGTLDAKGKLELGAKPPAADLTVDWQGVELPADLVGQPLATHGNLAAHGNADQFDARGEFVLGPPKQPADIAFELDGSPKAIRLRKLALRQPRGGLEAHGEIALQPQVGWNVEASAHKLDPGAFAAAWPGAIDFHLSTKGQMEKTGPRGHLLLDSLGGTLRQRALSGNADIEFALPLALNGSLELKSGNSSIGVRGKSDTQTAVDVTLAISSLGDWLPQAGGSLRGNVALRGAWPRLDARGHIDAAKLASGDVHADTVTLDLDVRDMQAPDGHASIDVKTFAAAGYLFDGIKLDASGNQGAHTLTLAASGPQLGASVKLSGALTANNDWQGTLATLEFAPKNAPAWTLQHPAQLSLRGGGVSVDQLCLGGDAASSICVSATQSPAGATQAKFAVTHLPLASIVRVASPDAPLKLDGTIEGAGDIARAADGALSGKATLTSAAGSIAYPDSATQSLIAYTNFSVGAALAPTQSSIDVRAALDHDGRLDGHIVLGAAGAGSSPLSGHVEALFNNLGIVDLLGEQTASTTGRINARFTLGGTTAAPSAAGDLALADFGTEIPAAGLKLKDGHVTLHSADGHRFVIDGKLRSGDGQVALSGDFGSASDAPLALKIDGENFLAADIPGARVQISPTLVLTRGNGKFSASGSVGIPKADIDIAKLPGGGAATVSPDVVVSDAQAAPATSATPLEADITVKLGAGEKLDMDLRQGQEVHLVGYGLNGYVSGQLAVSERPGRAASGRGQVVVNGTYKAYGQDLKIEQGRLLFAGTPLDNPGLDLRATRGFTDPEVTVGLQVRGTAQVPVLTVFSQPAMEQSDALSYLVAGKPLSQLKSGEGDAVGSAARALGTAGGDLLAKSIGSKMGLDDVGIADSSAVGGAALTVGKYLSPRLYLSYGVGLFTPGEVVTLRYRLSRLFNIEIQNGTLSSRAGINYKIEK